MRGTKPDQNTRQPPALRRTTQPQIAHQIACPLLVPQRPPTDPTGLAGAKTNERGAGIGAKNAKSRRRVNGDDSRLRGDIWRALAALIALISLRIAAALAELISEADASPSGVVALIVLERAPLIILEKISLILEVLKDRAGAPRIT